MGQGSRLRGSLTPADNVRAAVISGAQAATSKFALVMSAGFGSSRFGRLRASVLSWLLVGGCSQVLPRGPVHGAAHNTTSRSIREAEKSRRGMLRCRHSLPQPSLPSAVLSLLPSLVIHPTSKSRGAAHIKGSRIPAGKEHLEQRQKLPVSTTRCNV